MSIISISNGTLSVDIDTLAATLSSIRKDGIEYLWQADAKYWSYHDKNLFPYVGRLTDEKYIYNGKEYHMGLHGFCGDKEFTVADKSGSSVTLMLEDSEATYKDYPFRFRYEVIYSIHNNVLKKECRVTNKGDNEMFFGLGSHPGFNVPINGEGEFPDWYFEFPASGTPVRVGFDDNTHRLNDEDSLFELEDGVRLHLEHSCFDRDAIVLSDMPKTVTMKSDSSARAVIASYPDMDFLGLWHMPHTDAPYVCIEPWKSLPSHSGFIEDIAKQDHIVSLSSGESYDNVITFEII